MQKVTKAQRRFYGDIAYMNAPATAFGNKSDAKLRHSAHPSAISHKSPRSLQDLLTILKESPYFSMLQTTAGHISRYLDLPIEKVSIDLLVRVCDRIQSFKLYFEQRRFKRNAVRSYCGFASMLLREAKTHGWQPTETKAAREWQSIAAFLGQVRGCKQISKYAIRQDKVPAEFSDEDLETFAQEKLAQGASYGYVRNIIWKFRRFVSQGELAGKFPRISYQSIQSRRYGIPLHSLPAKLRIEVQALLTWKQVAYAEERQYRWKHRKITAASLESHITQLYGFVTTINPTRESTAPTQKQVEISTLIELVTEQNVRSFMKWLLNERKVLGETVRGKFRLIYAALKQHPQYKHNDFSWFNALLMEIPEDTESGRDERKERKYLPYEVVREIPQMIRKTRQGIAESDRSEIALLIRNELLMSWLLILPWRQINVRSCRIGRQSGSNLYKDHIPPRVNIPVWAKDRALVSPQERFWQYNFREDETKNGRRVRSLLPRRLIPLLEEYLEYRPALLNGHDPGTLFLNGNGKPLTRLQMLMLVGQLTLRYVHKRITPHMFRDIFAYWWLKNHPEDYLTVSKKLWHRNVEVTLRIYGCKYDESQADCRVEEYVEEYGATECSAAQDRN